MPKILKQISEKEFIEKLLSGERDFSGIKTENGFDLKNYSCLNGLLPYLKSQNFAKIPINISESDLRGANFSGIYLPYLVGEKTKFGKTNLSCGNFWRANFNGADFFEANLRYSNLCGACLDGASLVQADLSGADLRVASFFEADMETSYISGVNIKGIVGLEYSLNLEKAVIRGRITVSEEEQEIIENAIRRKKARSKPF